MMENKDLSVLQIQDHNCRWPGPYRHQGIVSCGIDPILLKYSGTPLERPGMSH